MGGVKISDQTVLSGDYVAANNNLTLYGNLPLVDVFGTKIKALKVKGDANNNKLRLTIDAKSIYNNDSLKIDNFNITSTVENDSALTKIAWLNKLDVLKNEGNITLKTNFNSFYNVSNQLENHLDKVKFFKEFWFYLPTDCLVFLKNYIDSIDQNEIENFKFEIFKDNHIDSYEDKIFDILLNFKQFNDYFRASVELFINYGLKNQLNFSKLLKVFTEGLTYGYYSSNTNYSNQIELFDILYAMALENKVFSEIILFIANKYLVHSFQTARNNGLQVEIHQKRVLDSIEQLEFRTKLFRYIFSCFRQGYKEGVYSFFFKYLTNHGYHTNLEILNHDKDLILEFFTNNFSKLTYKECSIVDKFISKLDRKEVDYPKGFNNGFISKEFLIYLKLSENKLKLRDFDGDYERFEDYKKNGKTLSKAKKQEVEKGLQAKQKQLNDYQQSISQQAQEEDQKLTQGVLNQVNSYIEEYGKENGYKIIFGANGSGTIFYGTEAINITNKVLLNLNKEYNGGA